MLDSSLRITEIFHSIQGEAKTVGCPTVFVRLTGCPLRCTYCDSEYAFHGGKRLSFETILSEVRSYNVEYVCVTGGEPLAQPACLGLLSLLVDEGYKVSLETSGAMDISSVDTRIDIVMDLKTPSSGELDKNLWANIPHLKRRDQVKFIIANKEDFDWSCFKIDEYDLHARVSEVLMSPSFGLIEAKVLAAWVIESRPKVRFQMQLHKLLWGDIPGV